MAQAPSLQKRVPLELAVVEEDDRHGLSDHVFEEMRRTLQDEAASLKQDGKLLSPRRERPEPTLQGSPAIKNARIPRATREQLTTTSNRSSTATSAREDVPVLPNLCCFFSEVAQTGSSQAEYPGLAALFGVGQEVDSRLHWQTESALDRRIREKMESAKRDEQAKQARQKELLASQRQDRDPHAVFMAEYNRVQTDLRIQADRDRAVLNDLDNVQVRAEKAEQRKQDELQEVKSLIQKRKEEREARSKARLAQVNDLLDEEEELRDQVLAANRIRHRFDKAKEEVLKGADVSKLDNY